MVEGRGGGGTDDGSSSSSGDCIIVIFTHTHTHTDTHTHTSPSGLSPRLFDYRITNITPTPFTPPPLPPPPPPLPPLLLLRWCQSLQISLSSEKTFENTSLVTIMLLPSSFFPSFILFFLPSFPHSLLPSFLRCIFRRNMTKKKWCESVIIIHIYFVNTLFNALNTY